MTFSEDDEEMNKEHLQMSNSIAKWMYEQVEVKKMDYVIMYEVLSEVLHILEWRLKYVMSHDDKLILHMKKVAEGRAKGIIEGFSILETTEFKEELKKWLGER